MPDSTSRLRHLEESVNWRPGSLWPYESLAAVGAKFAYLNRVRPSRFRKFLLDFDPKSIDIDFFSLIDAPDFSTRRFARVLGESERLIKQLKVGPFIPPTAYATNSQFGFSKLHPSIGWVGQHFSPPFRYCPICAKLGFHAIFHQLDLFSRCLIHDVELRQFSSASPRLCSLRRIDYLIEHAYEFFFMGSAGWEFSQAEAWKPVSRRSTGWEVVKSYLLLTKGAWSKSTVMGNGLIDCGSTNDSDVPTTVDVLRWIQWPEPLPKRIESSLQKTETSALPSIVRFVRQPGDAPDLGECFRQIKDVARFVAARRNWVHLTGENVGWHRLAQRCIEEMLVGHRRCWISLMRFRSRWPRANDPDADAAIQNICPRVIAIQRLQERWLFPHYFQWEPSSGVRFLVDPWNTDLGRELEVRSLAERLSVPTIWPDPDGIPRVYQLTAWQIRDEHLKAILDAISEMALLDEVWNSWRLETSSREANAKDSESCFYRTKWYLLQISADIVELHTWSRTPQYLPNWSLANHTDHQGGERLWKWAARQDCLRSGFYAAWLNSGMAESIGALSWENEGKRCMEIALGPLGEQGEVREN